MSSGDLSGLSCLFRQIFLPVSNREMPPFGTHSPEPRFVHSVLQHMHMCNDFGRRSYVAPHCRGAKISKVRWHAHGTIPCIHQRAIDDEAPRTQPANSQTKIGTTIP